MPRRLSELMRSAAGNVRYDIAKRPKREPIHLGKGGAGASTIHIARMVDFHMDEPANVYRDGYVGFLIDQIGANNPDPLPPLLTFYVRRYPAPIVDHDALVAAPAFAFASQTPGGKPFPDPSVPDAHQGQADLFVQQFADFYAAEEEAGVRWYVIWPLLGICVG